MRYANQNDPIPRNNEFGGYEIGTKVKITDYKKSWSAYKDTVGKIGTTVSYKSKEGNYVVSVGVPNSGYWIHEDFLIKIEE